MYYFRCLQVVVFSFIVKQVYCACNGYDELCDRSYANISYLVAHDSYAYGGHIAATQNKPVLPQLEDGVRGLKFSAVLPEPSSEIHLCHTSCKILDAGPAVETLNQIGQWLQEHPNEVVTIMWNNLYNIDIQKFAETYQASSVMPFVYTHPMDTAWPTLNDLIASGKRLVNFIDAMSDPTTAPWLMDQFSMVFETPYDNTSPDAFNCTIDRPRNPQHPESMMYVLNHFIYGVIYLGVRIEVPQKDKAPETNSDSLRKHVAECTQLLGRKPNFVEVDFYDQGDALDIVADINGLPLKAASMIPPPTTTPATTPTTTNLVGGPDFKQLIPSNNILSHILIHNHASVLTSYVSETSTAVLVTFVFFLIV